MANAVVSKNYPLHKLNLHVEERKGNAPAIIFLHGISMSREVWQKQLESEALSNYHLISVELPGHGTSDWSDEPETHYTLPGYAQLLQELIPTITDEKYVVAGYSLGGNVAIEALPGLKNCIGVLIVNTAVANSPDDIVRAFKTDKADVLNTILKEQADDGELDKYATSFLAVRNGHIPTTLADDYKKTDPKARTVLAQSVAVSNHADEIKIMQQAKVPIALITGEEDQLGEKTYLQDLEVPKWTGDTIMVPDAGHMPQLENSAYFDQKLVEFVEHCRTQSEAR
ncbi:alpha/beta hydrolase [Pontibacter sp. KCTC 32443]|uniref:alpha/beta fold hydrolase n=1 Tax=Pontibacter TaxID=323449 RepID=UPI00164DAE59|nr:MULTISPECIES: alpha/beta hydrolase [Pontibacter]MBC5773706.1 alpha/beta hydrolase [Pontibacter sp. KCTC 32443]